MKRLLGTNPEKTQCALQTSESHPHILLPCSLPGDSGPPSPSPRSQIQTVVALSGVMAGSVGIGGALLCPIAFAASLLGVLVVGRVVKRTGG